MTLRAMNANETDLNSDASTTSTTNADEMVVVKASTKQFVREAAIKARIKQYLHAVAMLKQPQFARSNVMPFLTILATYKTNGCNLYDMWNVIGDSIIDDKRLCTHHLGLSDVLRSWLSKSICGVSVAYDRKCIKHDALSMIFMFILMQHVEEEMPEGLQTMRSFFSTLLQGTTEPSSAESSCSSSNTSPTYTAFPTDVSVVASATVSSADLIAMVSRISQGSDEGCVALTSTLWTDGSATTHMVAPDVSLQEAIIAVSAFHAEDNMPLLRLIMHYKKKGIPLYLLWDLFWVPISESEFAQYMHYPVTVWLAECTGTKIYGTYTMQDLKNDAMSYLFFRMLERACMSYGAEFTEECMKGPASCAVKLGCQ